MAGVQAADGRGPGRISGLERHCRRTGTHDALLQNLIAINGFEASAHVNVTYSTTGSMDWTDPARIGGERQASGGVIGGDRRHGQRAGPGDAG